MRYVVPAKCVACETAGQVRLTARITGGAVAVAWYCRYCHHVWPINPHEQGQLEERHSGPPDRPRATRADRRKA
jgi:hypothetical protein